MDGPEKRPAFDQFLTTKDLAFILKVHPRTVARRKDDPGFPKPIRIGRNVRWDPEDIRKWREGGCKPTDQ